MAFEEIVKQVAETIQKEANVRAVFAEPMKLDTHIVVPVASVVVSIGGGGGGGSRKPGAELQRFFGGGGGGVNVTATPVGFIHEKDGQVVFTYIEAAKAEEKGLPAVAERLMNAFSAREKAIEKEKAKH
ncbi:MAG: spore germination protein GerW family protein [Myxococcales bacterium]